MEKDSIENSARRWEWLNKIVTNEVPFDSTLLAHLKDMNSFCRLSIEGYFTPLAYNTLKNVFRSSQVSVALPMGEKSSWKVLLSMRKAAYEAVAQAFPVETQITAKPDKAPSDYQMEIKESLWHSYMCTQAYLELFRKIKIFHADYMNALPTGAQYELGNIIEESQLKFHEVVSPHTYGNETSRLTLIEGGKHGT